MRSDEVIARLRRTAYIQDVSAWQEYSDQVLLDEVNDKLLSVFTADLIKARSGYGLKEQYLTCTIGQGRYPVPIRAIGGVLEKAEIAQPGTAVYTPLYWLPITEVQNYDLGPTNQGVPQYFTIIDGHLEMFPAPNAAYPLRFTFYIVPSQLVPSQSAGASDRGRITAINTTTRTVTVNTVPNAYASDGSSAAITSGSTLIDIVHPNGWFSTAMYSQPQMLAGNVFTLTSSDDMQDVRVGDYLRAAEQTDWPMIPKEFHRTLADRAAMEVLRETGDAEALEMLAQTVGADLGRFREILKPQVKTAPRSIPITPIYARGRSTNPLWRLR